MRQFILVTILFVTTPVIVDGQVAGNALHFDGVNDLVQIPNSSSLALGTKATVEAWAWLNSLSAPGGGGTRVLGKGDGLNCTSERSFAIGIGLNGVGPFWSSEFFTGTGPVGTCHWIDMESPQTVAFHQWVHLAMTLNTEVPVARLFLNGLPVVETSLFADDITPIAPETIRLSHFPLYIGALMPASNTFFDGYIDEVRIWNIARSPCEIAGSYDRQVDPSTPGLVGYWRFDEAGGIQNVLDSSPIGNNGTLGSSSSAASDDPTRVASTAPLIGISPDCNGNGVVDLCDISGGTSQDCNHNGIPDECEIRSPAAGQAIQYNGTNDYVQVPDSPALNLGRQITIEFWLNQRSYGQPDSGEWLLTKGDESVCNPFALAVVVGRNIDASFQFIANNSNTVVNSTLVPLSTWLHFAATLDTNTPVARGFTNGILTSETNQLQNGLTIPSLPVCANSLPALIGKFPPNFSAQFDEVRIWNIARTQSDIQSTMHRRLIGNEAGLVAYYRFDEGSGVTATNLATGYGVPNGTLVNNPAWVTSTAPIFEPNTSADCNGNGIPDSCDITSGFSQDCNGNGIPDSCDIASGFSHDCNTNGVPDTCEGIIAPMISTQPANQTACAGGSVTFSVVASGNPTPSYQWRKGLAIIPGATASSFTINYATSADEGSYNVVVSNSCGSTTSPDVTLTVLNQPTWMNLNPISGLSARRDHAMAYDSYRDRGVLFGGSDSQRRGDTWEWDGTTWQLRAITGPSPRTDHAMVYDSNRHVTILFGGYDGNFNGQTWEWDGTLWTLRSSSGPSPRAEHAMAYDAVRGVTVLFGGLGGQLNGETWEWNGSTWSLRSTTGPSARQDHAMAYDSVHSQVVLFAGYDGTNNGETWTWDGNAWTLRANTGPGKRAEHTMVFDASHGVVILFGGVNNPTKYSDTWTWDGTLWHQVAITGPSARYDQVAAYDSVRERMLMHGGFDSALNWETWSLSLSPTFSQQPQSQSVCVGTPISFTASAIGAVPVTYQWRKNGSNIGGATSSTFSIGGTSLSDNEAYDVVATDACGTVTSTVSNLTVMSNTPASRYSMTTLCSPSAITNANLLGFTDDGPVANSCIGQRSYRMFAGQLGAATGKVTRVKPGCVVQSFGPTLCSPESVMVDVHGRWPGICGAPNLLVVGACNAVYFINTVNGAICEQFPDPTFAHIGQMAIDSTGRLFAGSIDGDSLNVIDGGVVEPFYDATGLSPRAVAVDSNNNVYLTCAVDGVMRVIAPDGTPINESFASGLTGAVSQAIAPQGIFHGNMFVACGDRVMEVNLATGTTSTFLSCQAAVGIAFDPEGYMHVSIPSQNKLFKIGPALAGDMDGSGAVTIIDVSGFAAAALQLPNAPLPIATADMNGDGCVDGRDIRLFISAIVGP